MKKMLNLSEELLPFCELDFLQGGVDAGLTIDHPRFNHIYLPSLDIKKVTGKQFYDYLKARKRYLYENLDFSKHYDFFLVEQIPFSKLPHWNEVLALIQVLKVKNPNLLVLCSPMGIQRDKKEFIPEKLYLHAVRNDLLKVALIQKYFDYVLLPLDPHIVTFDETFERASLIADKCIYTGFMTKDMTHFPKVPREKRILVTIGGGADGNVLFDLIFEVALVFKDYEFILVKGAMMSEIDIFVLKEKIMYKGLPNVKLIDFLDNFEEELLKSSLSISMGGTTVYTVCATETPAIVFTLASYTDQSFIAKRFSDLGLVFLATQKHKDPQEFIKLVNQVLKAPYPKLSEPIDFNGLKKAAQIIPTLVKKKNNSSQN